MSKQSRIVLLLTACVSPNGMSYTVVQDPSIRENAYIDALLYYLQNTSYRIVFCNNSGEDLSGKIQDTQNRIEFLSYYGNDYDRSLGKGYGEYLIMRYVFENSRFLDTASYIIKITGKLKVLNIKEQLKVVFSLFGNRNNYLIVNLFPPPVSGADSRCFVFNTSFMHLFLYSGGDKSIKINDEKGFYFEHLLYQCVVENKKLFYQLAFPFPLQVDGSSWTDGEKYYLPSISNVSKLRIVINYIDKGYNRIDERFQKMRLFLMKKALLIRLLLARISNRMKLYLNKHHQSLSK